MKLPHINAHDPKVWMIGGGGLLGVVYLISRRSSAASGLPTTPTGSLASGTAADSLTPLDQLPPQALSFPGSSAFIPAAPGQPAGQVTVSQTQTPTPAPQPSADVPEIITGLESLHNVPTSPADMATVQAAQQAGTWVPPSPGGLSGEQVIQNPNGQPSYVYNGTIGYVANPNLYTWHDGSKHNFPEPTGHGGGPFDVMPHGAATDPEDVYPEYLATMRRAGLVPGLRPTTKGLRMLGDLHAAHAAQLGVLPWE